MTCWTPPPLIHEKVRNPVIKDGFHRVRKTVQPSSELFTANLKLPHISSLSIEACTLIEAVSRIEAASQIEADLEV